MARRPRVATVEAPDSHQWRRHRVWSAALRVAIVVVPIAISFGGALLLSRALPRPHDVPTTLLWVAVIVAAALLALVIFERAASRLLPLAALLNVSLLFPDFAPRRFAVARRAGRVRDLQAKLREAQASGDANEAAWMQTVLELVLALSVHDRATRGHSERVRVFTDLIADELKLSPEARARLRWAALLHGIGKLEVPATTLNKLDPLSGAEWAAIHRHPEEGARLVAPLLPWLDVWGLAVEQHHERYDGAGYPRRLRAHQISLAARIVAVADCYEVMTAPRPYKRAMSVTAARAELTRSAGTQFDPRIVRAFLNVSVGRLWRAIGVGALIAQIPVIGGLATGVRSWSAPGIAAAAAMTALAIGGVASTPAPHTPPGAVAGIRDSNPSPATPPATTSPPAPSATPPSVPVAATAAPAPAPQATPHYPITFQMNPLPGRRRAPTPAPRRITVNPLTVR